MNLRGIVSRFRKQSKRSLDGTVAGVEWNRYHGSHQPASAPIDLPYRESDQYVDVVHDGYDPRAVAANMPNLEYDQPYDLGLLPASAPPLQFDPVEPDEEPQVPYDLFLSMYEDEAMQQRDLAMEDQAALVEFGMGAEALGPPANIENTVAADPAPDALMDPLSEFAVQPELTDSVPAEIDPMAEAQAIFDQQMALFDELTAPSPEPVPQEMYDQQMMDPWMGPMGLGM